VIKNINVRFFLHVVDENNEIDLAEVGEIEFIKHSTFNILYERHTVFENGVNQVCLTLDNIDTPIYFDEVNIL